MCSEFKVNAIDADELRKSQRKIKRNAIAKKNLTLDIASFSVSGSQESDDDDDEGGSTPSADNSEKANSLTLSRCCICFMPERDVYFVVENLLNLLVSVSMHLFKERNTSKEHTNR